MFNLILYFVIHTRTTNRLEKDPHEHDKLLKKMVEAEIDADAAAKQVTVLRDVCHRLKEVGAGCIALSSIHVCSDEILFVLCMPLPSLFDFSPFYLFVFVRFLLNFYILFMFYSFSLNSCFICSF